MSCAGPVVHFSTAKSWRGGEQQALYLARGMKERGRDCLVVAQPGSPMAERSRAAGLRVEEVRCRAEFDIFAALKISSILRREKASVIHAHDAHGVLPAAFAGRMSGAKRVCTRRVDFAIKSPWKYTWGMDRTVCISAAIRDICLEAGLENDKLPIVLSGIDLARIESAECNREKIRAEFCDEKNGRRLIVLNVASLTDHKGQKYLIEAMPEILAKVPQTLFLIVGTGELEDELKRQARILAVEDSCLFLGFRKDVPALMKASDLFVMSSHLEGLCTSAMDALAAGLAVVATKAGGLPEVVDDGSAGLLVEPRDSQALADALMELLADRKKREKFARAAKNAAARFSYEKMVDGNLAIYDELCGGPEL